MIEYVLRCEQCPASMHIGRAFNREAKREEFYLFTGDHYEAICKFLITHENHPLRLVESAEKSGENEIR